MKVILLFSLFAVATKALLNSNGNNCPSNPDAGDPNCLAKSLKRLGDLFPAISKYVCAYNKLKEDKDVENYNAAANILIGVQKCAACELDKYLGKGKTLDDILVSAGETGVEALAVGIKILKTLGIDEVTAKLVCAVTGDITSSTCLRTVLRKMTPDTIDSVKDNYCKLNSATTEADLKSAADKALAPLMKATENLRCISVSENDDETLDNPMKDLRPEFLREMMGHMLSLTGQSDLIAKTVCPLINPVSSILN